MLQPVDNLRDGCGTKTRSSDNQGDMPADIKRQAENMQRSFGAVFGQPNSWRTIPPTIPGQFYDQATMDLGRWMNGGGQVTPVLHKNWTDRVEYNGAGEGTPLSIPPQQNKMNGPAELNGGNGQGKATPLHQKKWTSPAEYTARAPATPSTEWTSPFTEKCYGGGDYLHAERFYTAINGTDWLKNDKNISLSPSQRLVPPTSRELYNVTPLMTSSSPQISQNRQGQPVTDNSDSSPIFREKFQADQELNGKLMGNFDVEKPTPIGKASPIEMNNSVGRVSPVMTTTPVGKKLVDEMNDQASHELGVSKLTSSIDVGKREVDAKEGEREETGPGLGAVQGSPRGELKTGENLPLMKDGEVILSCHVCSFTGSTLDEFKSHMVIHFGHKCSKCDYTCRTGGRLKHHMTEFHRQSLNLTSTDSPGGAAVVREAGRRKNYQCRHCDFITVDRDEFWQHKSLHIPVERQLHCPHDCKFVTDLKHHLDYHLSNHAGTKPFHCDRCEYSCVNKSMLNSHMKSHSNYYPYRCADCAFASKYPHPMKIHEEKRGHQRLQRLNQGEEGQNLDLGGPGSFLGTGLGSLDDIGKTAAAAAAAAFAAAGSLRGGANGQLGGPTGELGGPYSQVGGLSSIGLERADGGFNGGAGRKKKRKRDHDIRRLEKMADKMTHQNMQARDTPTVVPQNQTHPIGFRGPPVAGNYYWPAGFTPAANWANFPGLPAGAYAGCVNPGNAAGWFAKQAESKSQYYNPSAAYEHYIKMFNLAGVNPALASNQFLQSRLPQRPFNFPPMFYAGRIPSQPGTGMGNLIKCPLCEFRTDAMLKMLQHTMFSHSPSLVSTAQAKIKHPCDQSTNGDGFSVDRDFEDSKGWGKSSIDVKRKPLSQSTPHKSVTKTPRAPDYAQSSPQDLSRSGAELKADNSYSPEHRDYRVGGERSRYNDLISAGAVALDLLSTRSPRQQQLQQQQQQHQYQNQEQHKQREAFNMVLAQEMEMRIQREMSNQLACSQPDTVACEVDDISDDIDEVRYQAENDQHILDNSDNKQDSDHYDEFVEDYDGDKISDEYQNKLLTVAGDWSSLHRPHKKLLLSRSRASKLDLISLRLQNKQQRTNGQIKPQWLSNKDKSSNASDSSSMKETSASSSGGGTPQGGEGITSPSDGGLLPHQDEGGLKGSEATMHDASAEEQQPVDLSAGGVNTSSGEAIKELTPPFTTNMLNKLVVRRLEEQFLRGGSNSTEEEEEEEGEREPKTATSPASSSPDDALADLCGGKYRHECSHCGLTFRDYAMYTIHMGYHGFVDPFMCNMCGKMTADKVDFFVHIARVAH